MNSLTTGEVVQGEYGIRAAVEVWLVGDITPTINGVIAGCPAPGLLLDDARTSTSELGRVFMPWSAIVLIRQASS